MIKLCVYIEFWNNDVVLFQSSILSRPPVGPQTDSALFQTDIFEVSDILCLDHPSVSALQREHISQDNMNFTVNTLGFFMLLMLCISVLFVGETSAQKVMMVNYDEATCAAEGCWWESDSNECWCWVH